MKYLLFLVVAVVALVGCGAGHANLTSITVSPQSATTTSNPQGQVGYTATGNFANGKSRELSQVDGLSWKTLAPELSRPLSARQAKLLAPHLALSPSPRVLPKTYSSL